MRLVWLQLFQFRRRIVRRLPPLSKEILTIISVGFLVALVGIFFLLKSRHKAAADNWQVDEDQYRKQVTITNNTSGQTGVYVQLTIDTSDTTRFQADCGDVRFIKANGEILPYYISSGCGTATTTFNIYFDNLIAGPQDFYVYYGNGALRDGFSPSNFSTLASSYAMGTPASEEKSSGPAGFWKFDEGYGSTAHDSSYNRNDGSLGGTALLGTGSTANVIRQEINMIDGTLTGTHVTAVSNALVQVDTTQYGGTILAYFEVVGTATASSTGSIRLRRNGTTTDDATISISSLGTTTTRLRSTSFSPPAGQTEYFVYVDDAGASKTVTIKAARIIIKQVQNGLTTTESQFEIGNQELAKTNTSTAALSNPKYWTYDDTHWDPIPTLYAEATYKKIDTGTAIPTYVNKGTFTSGTGALSVPVPSGYQDGDVFLLFVESANQAISTPTGWTEVANSPQSTGTAATAGGVRLAVFYKIVSGAQSNVSVADTGNHTTAIIANFRGVDTSNPIMITAGSVDSSATSSLSWPAVTTTSTNALIVNAVGLDKDLADTDTLTGTYTNGNLANLTERHDQTVASGVGGGIAFATGEKASTGSTGNTTVTADSSTTHAYLTIALTGGIDTSHTVTMYLQEDNGSFAGWSNIATIVNASTTSNTVTRARSSAFTPTATGRHYRIVSAISSATNSSYEIYNAKIVADQSATVYAFESQYLLLNTADSGSTGRQGYTTLWDESEWDLASYGYYYSQDATNAADSSKLQDIDNGNSDITDATVTGANQQIAANPMTPPTTGHQMDVNVTNTTGVVNAARLISTIYVDAPSSFESTTPDWRTDQCLSDKCLYFDGSYDDVLVANNTAIDMDQNLANGFTYSMWVKPTTPGENGFGTIFLKGLNTYAQLYANGGNITSNMVVSIDLDGTDATVDIQNAMTLNSWHHVEIGYTNDADDEISVYIDGQLKAQSTNGSGNPATDSDQLIIGGFLGSHFNGFMDEFKIYNQERTAAQVKTDYLLKTTPQGVQASFGQQSNEFLNQGMVGYWPLEDTASPALDLSGTGNPGTWVGGATTAAGKLGNAISLDGTGDYITVADNSNLSPQDITLSAWIKLSVLPSTIARSEMIMRKADTQTTTSTFNNYQFYVQSAANTLRFEWYQNDNTSNSINGTTALTTGTWYHVMVTKNGNVGKIFLNGVEDGSNTLTDNTFDSDSTFYIGSNGSGADLKGQIDDARVYGRGLSPAEARSLYSWGPSPVGSWNFDESSGTTAYDNSGNGNNGTLTGGTWLPGKYGNAYATTDGSPYEYVTVADSTSNGILDFSNTQSYSFSFWYKQSASSTSFVTPFTKGGDSNTRAGYDFEVDTSTNDASCKYTDGNGTGNDKATYSASPVLDGSWYFITCVMNRESNTYNLYVNGVLQGSDTSLTEGSAASSTRDLIMGESEGSYTESSRIDQVKIYNYARTSSQIIEDMNAGHPVGGSPVGSPAIYYKFDEGYGTSSTSVHDSSVNNLTAGFNVSNPATWTNDCKFNRCLTFDDTHYGVRRSHVSFLDGISQMSISMWVKPTTLTVNRVLAAQSDINLAKNSTSQNQFVIAEDSTTSSEIRVYIASGLTDTSNYCKTSGLGLTNGTWDKIAIIYDGSQSANKRIRVYKNGKSVTCTVTGTIPTALTTNTAQFYVGASDGPDIDVFNGAIDEYKLYTTALTQEQVYADANRGKSMVMGATSTGSDGTQPSNAASREYCLPGDTTSCTAPIGEWKMNENTGTTVNDTSGNNNNGTLSGTVGNDWTNGKIGGAINFNGVDEYVTVSNTTQFDMGTSTPFTVELWFKDTDIAGTRRTLFDSIVNGANYHYRLELNGGFIRGQLVDSAGSTFCTNRTLTNIEDSKWHHVAALFYRNASCTTNDIQMYVDGQPAALTNINASFNTNVNLDESGINFGGKPNYGRGPVDEVRLFNYIRTPAQISWDYNRGAPIGWYRFDACQGTTAFNAASDANGSSLGMNGTITIGSGGTNTSAGSCNGNSSQAWKNGATGKINSSLSFDGSDDYVDIGNVYDLSGNTPMTISAWVNVSAFPATDGKIVSKYNDGTAGEWYLGVDSVGTIEFLRECGNYGTTSRKLITTGSWYHVAGVYDGTNNKIYINGILDKSAADSCSISATTTKVRIGADDKATGSQRNLNSLIDDVRIYNYALTDVQIRDVYNNGTVSFK